MKCRDCEKPAKAKGLCRVHYNAERRKTPEGAALRAKHAASYRQRHAEEIAEWHRKNRQGFSPEQREAERARQRDGCRARYAALSPEEKQAFIRKQRARKTGWSEEAWQRAFQEQHGACAICPRELTPGRGTCADHYETVVDGRVPPGTKGSTKHPRALLCRACNSGLGHYEAPNGQRWAGLLIPQYEAYIAKYGG